MGKMGTNNNYTGVEIAVIGMAGKFPGAVNIDEFWDNLKNGRECITFLSCEELKEAGVENDMLEDPYYVMTTDGLMGEKEFFDAYFFDYSPGEAEVMEPQIRLLHEYSWEALENAGYDSGSYNGLIGIFVGANSSFYWEAMRMLSGKGQEMGLFAVQHFSNKDFLSTRVAYKLNLRGPALTIQTACSTSLVAIHIACQAILNGECDMALAGGVSVNALETRGYIYQEGSILSSDGHCRAFDAKADGTAGGEGIGIVLLKSLESALVDRDYIHAVVKGSAINNDGINKSGYSAPSREGQTEVIQIAHQVAEVNPESITYVETHGTGTPLGDPIEIEALKMAFNTEKRGFCAIGSVKTNVGHLDSAAGVTGFIKTVLALKHRLIPPSLHFENPNPEIDFENSPFYVNTTLREWNNDDYPLRAGVSSLGIGGTNAHVVLEVWNDDPSNRLRGTMPGAQAEIKSNSGDNPHHLILLSAKTSTALDIAMKNLAGYLKKNPSTRLADVAYTVQAGRKTFKNRGMAVCSSIESAIEIFDSPMSGKVQTSFVASGDKPVVFMFSGQGSQYVNMGLELYQKEKIFRTEIDRCLEILENIMGHNIKSILYPFEVSSDEIQLETALEKINDVIYSGPIKFIFEYALSKMLINWGINPYAMIGHSFGEYTAAHIAGVFSLEDALSLVVLRGKLMSETPAGIMMSVPLSEHHLMPLLGEELSLAAVNTESLCIVSGPTAVVEDLEQQLTKKGHECLRINFPRASHSKMMSSIFNEFEAAVSRITLNKPQIPYISGLTGTWVSVADATNPRYWARHLLETMRFSDGVKKILEKDYPVFIQVGSDRGLPLFIKDHQKGEKEIPVINLVKHKKEKMSDLNFLMNSIGQLWLHGANIDWAKFYPEETRYRIPLPTYPFERRFYWFESDIYNMGKKQMINPTFLFGKKSNIADWFYLPSWKSSLLPVLRPGHLSRGCTWLIFVDDDSASTLGNRVIKKLQQYNQDIITVKMGMKFSRINVNEYVVNPAVNGDYDSLFTALGKPKRYPLKIIYLWSISHEDFMLTPGGYEAGIVLGFNSLIYLLQAIGKLGKADEQQEYQLFVITRGMQKIAGQPISHPEYSLVQGPVKVSPLEYGNIVTRSIDIDGIEPSTPQEERFINHLVGEFMLETRDLVIAYRGNERLVQTFEPVHLEKIHPGALPLKEKGTYLLTGGLSGIGLELAGYLAQKVQAKLILMGRSQFPARNHWEEWLTSHDKNNNTSRKILRLKEFEAWGAEIMTCSGNVSDKNQVEKLLDRVRERFGIINGVIHAAGIPDGSIIQRKTEEIMNLVLEAKVKGTLVLDHALRNIPLDFFILCSSLNSIIPEVGQVGYCAANAFLDAFAHHRMVLRNGLTISINWGGWQNTGMSIAVEKKHKEITGEDLKGGMTPMQGIDAFERILANSHSQVVVSTINIAGFIKNYNPKVDIGKGKKEGNTPPSKHFYPRPDLSTEYIAPTNGMEQSLTGIWQEFFGIEPIGIRDDFFELGGDSLKAMTLISFIHKKLEVRVPVSDFFVSGTNIRQLAEYISSDFANAIYAPINPVEKKEFYCLSHAQKRMYILYQMNKESTAYNVSQVKKIEGAIAVEKLEEAFRMLIRRHESLRTSFTIFDGEIIQKIHQDVDFKIDQYEASEVNLQSILNSLEIPFDLGNGPLLRVALVKISPEKHLLAVSMHHIISDGFSLGILVEEFSDFFNGNGLPSLKLGYKDYAEWQNKWLNQPGFQKKSHDFWKKKLELNVPVLRLAAEIKNRIEDIRGAAYRFMIGEKEREKLNRLARENNTTLFIVMFSAYLLFLFHFSKQRDIRCSIINSAREYPELRRIIGSFVNSVLFGSTVDDEEAFVHFIRRVHGDVMEVFQHQGYPMEQVCESLKIRYPEIRISFNMLNIHDDISKREMDMFEPYHIENYNNIKFDVEPYITEYKNGIDVCWVYKKDLFEPDIIEFMIKEYIKIIDFFSTSPGKNYKTYQLSNRKRKVWKVGG